MGGSVKPVLLAEASLTRRRALSALLARRGCAVTALASLEEAYTVLKRLASQPTSFTAVVLGWPEYADGVAEDVFGLLHGDHYEHLPVLVLADAGSAGAVNWRMTRPRTALLQWNEYHEAADALDELLRPPPAAAPALEPAGHLRILLVDDSATVRMAFSRLLARYGYVVDTADGVAEGMEKARQAVYDIAIVDYFMPGANGTQLIAALQRDPQTAHVLSATLTGTYSDSIITESLAAGAVEVLFKSEAKELFLARLNSLARTVRDRQQIDNERRRLQGILASVGDGVYGVDAEGRIQFVNPAAVDILGYGAAEDLVGRIAFETFHYAFEDGTTMPRQASFLDTCYASGSRVPAWQTVFWTASRRAVPVECTVFPMQIDGLREGSVVAFRDVSARRMLEEELRWAAEHDPLTKLHNRAWFERQLEQEISRLKRGGLASVLLFIDVDRFKYINDTAGHGAGDQLLLEVSQRLKSRLRGSDHLARMGGDEYAVILRNVVADDVHGLADGFRRALSAAPFVYGGKSYRITVSVGAARLDQHCASATEAMQQADIACYAAKNGGRNQTQMYEPEGGARAAMDAELGWAARLEEALRGDRFALCFQPIVPLVAGKADVSRPALYEVLLRYRDSHGELVAPTAFLPSAERFGLMDEIDRWVIERAIRVLRERRLSQPELRLSVNLSTQSLASESLVGFVTDKLVQYNVDPGALVFEVAEARALVDTEATRRLVKDLRVLGCRVAVEDFGTGFSSFAYLRALDADFLKIDAALAGGRPDDPLDLAIIASLVRIARVTGKSIIAECVEDPLTLAMLAECGVDYAQGHAIGYPRPELPLPSPPPTLEADDIGAVA